MITMLADSNGSAAGGVFVGLLIVIACAYFLPSIVAAIRHVPNVGSVVVLNLLLGWTLIGWVVSLAMACRSPHAGIVVQNHMSTPNQPPIAQHLPPGWYPDPWNQSSHRFWNGQGWTDQVA